MLGADFALTERMEPLLIVYATREGHTKHIVERITLRLRQRGIAVELENSAYLSADFELPQCYRAVLVAASVHQGRYEPEMVDFVRRHSGHLERIPSAFLSVGLSEAAAHSPLQSRVERERAAARVDAAIAHFRDSTGWRPSTTLSVAGALQYRRYRLPMRWVMKAIARALGLSTDTSQDHVFTDWPAVDRFADQFADKLRQYEPAAARTECV
jgi:menaquinone-dependent protoporphyrinogen oxidase